MGSVKFVLVLFVFASVLESAFSDHDPNHVGTTESSSSSSSSGSEENAKKLKEVLEKLTNSGKSSKKDSSVTSSSSPPSETSESSSSTTKLETSTTSSFSSSSSTSTTSSLSSSTSSKSSSSSTTSTTFGVANSTSTYWSPSTGTLAPPNEEYCYTDAVFQNFCVVPNDMTDVSFWDLYSVLFSDTVLDALMMGCTRGSWCLQDRFDYWDALIAERVDMVTLSEISKSMCQPDLNTCINTTTKHFQNCSTYPVMEYTTEALTLICKLKQGPINNTSTGCFKHVITALHVTLADIMRSETDDIEQDKCEAPEAQMTRGLICVENSCPGDYEKFNSFRPWKWFTKVVDDLIGECDMDATKCLALLRPPPGYVYGKELTTMIAASIATTVSALLLAISMCVCYKRYRRNAVIKDGYQKLLSDGDES